MKSSLKINDLPRNTELKKDELKKIQGGLKTLNFKLSRDSQTSDKDRLTDYLASMKF